MLVSMPNISLGEDSQFLLHSFLLCIAGDNLYDSATRLRIPDLPAFALECLPNRNSLICGDLYGIASEASTIFRGTLRYEGMPYIGIYVFSII